MAALVCLVTVAQPLRGQPGAEQPRASQAARLDDGSFTLWANGERIGREQFSMQRSVTADGALVDVRAESSLRDRRGALRLTVDSAGTPVRYVLEERRGTELALRLGGQRERGRFTTLARSLTGESAREYLLRPGAVIVEEEGVIPHVLLVRERRLAAGEGITLPSLSPTANAQGVVRIVLEAVSDTVSLAGTRRVAQRWRVVTGTGELRQLWTDPEGRLLRLTIPSRAFDARRDDVPR